MKERKKQGLAVILIFILLFSIPLLFLNSSALGPVSIELWLTKGFIFSSAAETNHIALPPTFSPFSLFLSSKENSKSLDPIYSINSDNSDDNYTFYLYFLLL